MLIEMGDGSLHKVAHANCIGKSCMNSKKLRSGWVTIFFVSIAFVLWGLIFIYNSSFVAIDGIRYYCLFDDAMISMRYAWNMSHGYGLVWNQGESVQGYTNLLMTLIMTLATCILNKIHAVYAMQIFGICVSIANAYVIMRIANQIDTSTVSSLKLKTLYFAGALLYYPLIFWSLMGMETGLLTLLLSLSVFFAFSFTSSSRSKYLYLLAISLGMAYMTRNDSLVYALLIVCYTYNEMRTIRKRDSCYSTSHFWRALMLYLIFVIGQLVFQHFYYGNILPNTYYLKLTGMPLLTRLQNGVGFVAPYLVVTVMLYIVSVISTMLQYSKRKMLLLSLSFAAIVYQVYVGGDPWELWRITSPTMPIVIMLYLNALYHFCKIVTVKPMLSQEAEMRPLFAYKKVRNIIFIMTAICGILVANIHFVSEIIFLRKPYSASSNRNNVNVAVAISELTTDSASIGLLWAGAIPYYSERRAIDFLGKSDAYIANLPPDLTGAVSWNGMSSVPGHNKYNLYYSIVVLKPTYVQSFVCGSQDLTEWAESMYVSVQYRGVHLSLLNNSSMVEWEQVRIATEE